MMPPAMKPDPRPEGAYVSWANYPPDQIFGLGTVLFTIERVTGARQVISVTLTPEEARLVVAKLTDGLSRL